jgi:hypothetical protein
MAEAGQDPRNQLIAELQAQVKELRAKLTKAQKRQASRELSLIEDGLRLSQENEMLRKELAELKKSRK